MRFPPTRSLATTAEQERLLQAIHDAAHGDVDVWVGAPAIVRRLDPNLDRVSTWVNAGKQLRHHGLVGLKLGAYQLTEAGEAFLAARRWPSRDQVLDR